VGLLGGGKKSKYMNFNIISDPIQVDPARLSEIMTENYCVPEFTLEHRVPYNNFVHKKCIRR